MSDVLASTPSRERPRASESSPALGLSAVPAPEGISESDELVSDGLMVERGVEASPFHQRYEALQRDGVGPGYTAFSRTMGQRVRVDLTPSDCAAELWQRFELLAPLRHPGIAAVYDAGVVDLEGTQWVYLASELLPERSWCQFDDWSSLNEHLTQLVEALAYLHARGHAAGRLRPEAIRFDAHGALKLVLEPLPLPEQLSLRDVHYRAAARAGLPFGPLDDVYALGTAVQSLLARVGSLPEAGVFELLELLRGECDSSEHVLAEVQRLAGGGAPVVAPWLLAERPQQFHGVLEELARFVADTVELGVSALGWVQWQATEPPPGLAEHLNRQLRLRMRERAPEFEAGGASVAQQLDALEAQQASGRCVVCVVDMHLGASSAELRRLLSTLETAALGKAIALVWAPPVSSCPLLASNLRVAEFSPKALCEEEIATWVEGALRPDSIEALYQRTHGQVAPLRAALMGHAAEAAAWERSRLVSWGELTSVERQCVGTVAAYQGCAPREAVLNALGGEVCPRLFASGWLWADGDRWRLDPQLRPESVLLRLDDASRDALCDSVLDSADGLGSCLWLETTCGRFDAARQQLAADADDRSAQAFAAARQLAKAGSRLDDRIVGLRVWRRLHPEQELLTVAAESVQCVSISVEAALCQLKLGDMEGAEASLAPWCGVAPVLQAALVMSSIHRKLGRWDAACSLCERARTGAREQVQPELDAEYGLALFGRGDRPKAEEVLSTLNLETLGSVAIEVALARSALAIEAGDVADARRLLRAAYDAQGAHACQLAASCELLRLLVRHGPLVEAEQVVEEATLRARACGAPNVLASIQELAIQLELLMGRPEGALLRYEGGVRLLAGVGTWLRTAPLLAARAYRRLGDAEAALEVLDSAAAASDAADPTALQRGAERALTLLMLDRVEDAAALLDEMGTLSGEALLCQLGGECASELLVALARCSSPIGIEHRANWKKRLEDWVSQADEPLLLVHLYSALAVAAAERGAKDEARINADAAHAAAKGLFDGLPSEREQACWGALGLDTTPGDEAPEADSGAALSVEGDAEVRLSGRAPLSFAEALAAGAGVDVSEELAVVRGELRVSETSVELLQRQVTEFATLCRLREEQLEKAARVNAAIEADVLCWREQCRALREVAKAATRGRSEEAVAVDVETTAASADVVRLTNLLAAQQEKNTLLEAVLGARDAFPELVLESDAMRRLAPRLMELVADDIPVVVYGEAGAGKAWLCRQIHGVSARRTTPLVEYDCGVGGANEQRAELLGEQGAFARAAGAGLLLRHVDRLVPELQGDLAAAFRASSGPAAASNISPRLLATASRAGLTPELRELFSCTLTHPPLRERTADLELLVARLWRGWMSEAGAGSPAGEPTRALLRQLLQYPFPGNVRELVTLISEARARADGGPVTAAHLPNLARLASCQTSEEARMDPNSSNESS